MNKETALRALMDKIGERLRQIRISRGEKLISIEISTGIHHSILSRIENGTYSCLSFHMLSRLAAYYNVELEQILAN